MKRFAIGLFIVALTFTSLPAVAMSRAQTRDVQEKLLLLGYEPGPIDGLFGKQTRTAVLAFQKDAEIKVDGKVGPQTRKALTDAVAMYRAGGKRLGATNHQLDVYEDVLTDRLNAGEAQVSSRYAKVTFARADKGRAYTMLVNGQSVFTSDRGVGLPRISRTFEVAGEDVLLLTSAQNNRNCPLKHTVVAVRADASVAGPVDIGNCQELINGRVQDRQVVFSFPPTGQVESWRITESWAYEGGTVTGP